VQCHVVLFNAVQYSAVMCSAVVQLSAVAGCAECWAVEAAEAEVRGAGHFIRHLSVSGGAVQCSAVYCSAVQWSAVQCSAVQCSAVH
jgi:hypothetical protein